MKVFINNLDFIKTDIQVDFGNGSGFQTYSKSEAKSGISIPSDCSDWSKITVKANSSEISSLDVYKSFSLNNQDSSNVMEITIIKYYYYCPCCDYVKVALEFPDGSNIPYELYSNPNLYVKSNFDNNYYSLRDISNDYLKTLFPDIEGWASVEKSKYEDYFDGDVYVYSNLNCGGFYYRVPYRLERK